MANTVSGVPTKVAHWVGVMETTSGERMVALVSRRQYRVAITSPHTADTFTRTGLGVTV